MCRLLAYLGPELPLENLLLKPANSLINQSRAPKNHPLVQPMKTAILSVLGVPNGRWFITARFRDGGSCNESCYLTAKMNS